MLAHAAAWSCCELLSCCSCCVFSAISAIVVCRDRAKERRDGLNIDFADAEQELAARGLGPTALQSLTIGTQDHLSTH